MRFGVAIVLASLCISTALADVWLTAKRVDPTTVELVWTSGAPFYQVYRAPSPGGLATPSNLIAFTGLTSYTDAAASGNILFYVITDGHCAAAADCPATGNPCTAAVCNAGDCGTSNLPFGSVLASQTAGDCETSICDGTGGVTQQADNADLPVDGNGCTADVCTGGVPSNPPLSDGASCSDGDGSVCRSGVCLPTISVLRVGDGVTALSASASSLTIERRSIDGPLLGTVALPTSFSANNAPCTLSGTATSEGSLSRGTYGTALYLGAYGASPGVANIASSSSSTVNRVVCTVDGAGTVDSTTWLSSAFNAGNVRGATSTSGGTVWVSGTSSGTTGGVWAISHGSHTGTQILPTPNNTRWVGIANDQLYADSGSSPYTNVFTVGSGLPTSVNQTATSLPGLPTTGASPYGFVFFDLNPNVAGLDTLYLADDRAIASGGGIQRWTFDGANWTLAATLSSGITTGVRGLAGYKQADGSIALFATTGEATANKLVRFVDDGSPSPTATLLATAPTNTVYRGVALTPH